MDIKEIGVANGQNQTFMDLVHDSMKEKCAKYVKKARGPTNIFMNLDHSTPIEYVKKAFKPLEKYRNKIGVVIDGSTTKGFSQPSQASLYCQELGITPYQAFDMMEACNGFSRALETAYMLFQTKPELSDKYILLINNEQPPKTRGILPSNINDYKTVASYYVGLTFSHVTTCTLIEKSANHSWKFHHYTRTHLATNINIPLPQISKGYEPQPDPFEISYNDEYGQYCIPSGHDIERKIIFLNSTVERNVNFYKQANVICHTFSRFIYEKFLENAELQRLSLYYNETGNLGTCSYPWILHDQYIANNGQLPVGQNFVFVGNAAGGSNIIVESTHRAIQMQIYDPVYEKQNMNKYYVMLFQRLKKKIRSLRGKKEYKIMSLQNPKQNPSHLKMLNYEELVKLQKIQKSQQ